MTYSINEFRRKALTALKGHWQTALIIALIVNLPMLLAQGITVFSGNDLTEKLQAVFISATRDGVFTQDLLTEEINAFMQGSGFWSTQALYLAAWLVTPCLTLGMYSWILNRLRGQEEPVSAVFSRVHMFFKALGLHLLIALKLLLWALPGIALTVLLAIPASRLLAAGGSSEAQLEYSVLVVEMLSINCIAAVGIPVALAAIRYSLSEYILTEEPGEKITVCVKRSKAMTKRKIRPILLLVLRFLPLFVIQMFLSSLLGSGVLALVFQMLTGLALGLYFSTAFGALFLAYTGNPGKTVPAEAENAVSDSSDAD